jgi:hypothetical protein
MVTPKKGNTIMSTTPKFKPALATSLVVLGTLICGSAQADNESQVIDFQTHAAFFSNETHQKSPLDPQVFVAEPAAVEAIGPQGIKHVAGTRNALIGETQGLPLLNASGKPLDMSLGAWLASKGQVILTPLSGGREKVTVILSDLKPRGHYSLFENHFDQQPIGFTPLDGTGADNNFVADGEGKAVVTTVSPTRVTHDNAVLVVYHSDGKTHGTSRGDLGVNAHHQLIARP